MDTFTFMISLLMMMLAVQFDQNWLVFAIVAIMVVSMRSASTTLLLIISAVVLFFAKSVLQDYWPFVLFGLLILALLVGIGGKGGGEGEAMPMDMYGGLEGGMGGLPGGL